MAHLHLFNPSHEMALAANSLTYTPPKSIQAMERDLCRLPLLWAEPDDLILTPDGIFDTEGKPSAITSALSPMPWGWNKAARHRFLRLGISENQMPSEEDINRWRGFASRKWAVEYSKLFYGNASAQLPYVENNMQFCSTSSDIQEWLKTKQGNTVILKSEYSSSGRGNHIINTQESSIESNLNQNYFSRLSAQCADIFYEKLIDFAMEFEITGNGVNYLGLSVFEASREGKYSYNHVLPQSKLRQMILSCMQNRPATILQTLADTHSDLLRQLLVGKYKGIVGIDMMVVKGGKIHPCIEINIRNNMGVLALFLQEHNITNKEAARCGGTLFKPIIEDNKFYIATRHITNIHN